MSKLPPALIALLLLAACGGGGKESDGNRRAAAAAPASTLPPPRTPVMNVTPAAGDAPSWLEPRPDHSAPEQLPRDDLADPPVVTTGKP